LKQQVRQRGVLHVAFYDLLEALSDPVVKNANITIPEVTESFRLLKEAFVEVGGNPATRTPAPK
jgi:hypothetical protein